VKTYKIFIGVTTEHAGMGKSEDHNYAVRVEAPSLIVAMKLAVKEIEEDTTNER